MPFIKMPIEFFSLPRILKYIQLSSDHGASLPIHAAILAAKESPRSGHMLTPSADALEKKWGWEGAPGRGIDAMIRAGLIEKVEDGYVFLGWNQPWEEEQGHIIKFHEKARKAAKALWNRVSVDAPSIAPSNAPSIAEGGGATG